MPRGGDDKKGKRRLASLTISRPISHSHKLTSDFSLFLEKSHSKIFGGSAGCISKLVSKLSLKKVPSGCVCLVNV